MPYGDGSGPVGGSGPGTGRGLGGANQSGGRGQGAGGFGAGPVGDCVCPNCGNKEPHQRGVPCFQQKCSKCGSTMTRDF